MPSPALRLALAVSLVLHALLAATLWEVLPARSAEATEAFEVAFVPESDTSAPDPSPPRETAPAVPENQIISPPESPEAPPEKETRFRSDRNSRAEEETVHRGELGSEESGEKNLEPSQRAKARRESPTDSSEQSSQDAPASSSDQSPSRSLPDMKDLILSPSEALTEADEKEHDETSPREDAGPEALASVQRPDLFSGGDPGIPDYLPRVRDGRFTLLNTKADRFAPFVRRVGLRVFQSFSMKFRREIQKGEVPRGEEQLKVEAVMSPEGRRINVYLRDRQGNLATDRVLLDVLNDRVFFDSNPPEEAAASDGRIHFVFALDAAVWQARDPSSGAPRPGARWVFGAGLL